MLRRKWELEKGRCSCVRKSLNFLLLFCRIMVVLLSLKLLKKFDRWFVVSLSKILLVGQFFSSISNFFVPELSKFQFQSVNLVLIIRNDVFNEEWVSKLVHISDSIV